MRRTRRLTTRQADQQRRHRAVRLSRDTRAARFTRRRPGQGASPVLPRRSAALAKWPRPRRCAAYCGSIAVLHARTLRPLRIVLRSPRVLGPSTVRLSTSRITLRRTRLMLGHGRRGHPWLLSPAGRQEARRVPRSPNTITRITPIMPTSWLCRCGHRIPRTVRLPCDSGRHNPDVITVLASGHYRDRAAWRGPHRQSARRRSRAETPCRRGHRCLPGLDRPSRPCGRSRRRPRAPRRPGSL
jgi:hypothetical protein